MPTTNFLPSFFFISFQSVFSQALCVSPRFLSVGRQNIREIELNAIKSKNNQLQLRGMQQQSLLSGSNPEESNLSSASQTLSPVERLLERVGGEGKFQLISFLVFCLLWFLTSWLLLGMSFFFDDSFTCADPLYSDDDTCKAYVCGLPSADRPSAIGWHSQSIAFEFADYMICDDFENQIPILQSMLFFGALVGFFVIPNIADNSGRKGALRVAWVVGIVSLVATVMADSPRIVGFGLFFIGFGTNPAITLAFSFINEQSLGKSRQRFGVGVQIGLALGESTIALIFLSDLTWREIMVILLILFVVAHIPLELCLKETPMYLIEKSHTLTLRLLNEIGKINGQDFITEEEFESLRPKEVQLQEGSEVSVRDLFRYPSLRWVSISTGIIFMGIQTIYYSTTLNLGEVGFSKTINQVIFGVSEMFGYVAAEFVVYRVPRKRASYLGLGIASGMCLVLGALLQFQTSENKWWMAWVQAVGLMINRFILCGFWSIFYVYVAELYPTQTRSLGYGWTSVMGMIGSTLSPFVTTISSFVGVNSWFPPAILGLLSCLFIAKLPETFGEPLKDIISELEKGHEEAGVLGEGDK